MDIQLSGLLIRAVDKHGPRAWDAVASDPILGLTHFTAEQLERAWGTFLQSISNQLSSHPNTGPAVHGQPQLYPRETYEIKQEPFIHPSQPQARLSSDAGFSAPQSELSSGLIDPKKRGILNGTDRADASYADPYIFNGDTSDARGRVDRGIVNDNIPAASAAGGPTGRRIPKPWTPSETQALKEGVAKHGAGKWADILADRTYQFQSHRTNVDLKDKWRSLTKVSIPAASPRVYKSRVPWAHTEVEALLLGIQRHGLGNWATVAKDPQLSNHGATQIRDKWRGLKTRYVNMSIEEMLQEHRDPVKKKLNRRSAREQQALSAEEKTKEDEVAIFLANKKRKAAEKRQAKQLQKLANAEAKSKK